MVSSTHRIDEMDMCYLLAHVYISTTSFVERMLGMLRRFACYAYDNIHKIISRRRAFHFAHAPNLFWILFQASCAQASLV